MSRWERRAFVPSDAQHFWQGDAHGWTKVGVPLSSDQVPTHIEKDGWDHEECQICGMHIGRGVLAEGYVNHDDEWLCQTCYERARPDQSAPSHHPSCIATRGSTRDAREPGRRGARPTQRLTPRAAAPSRAGRPARWG
jgi:hypothetical protein